MDKVWQRESEPVGNPTLMLWVVLDGVEEKLHVQSRQRSLYCVFSACFVLTVRLHVFLCEYSLGHGLI